MSQLKLLHSGGNGVILAAPTNNPASDVTFKLPQADGTSGQALTTNASGQLGFASIAAGITEYDEWYLTSSALSNGDLTSLARNAFTGSASPLGTGMSQSSGIFTFPSTGKWLIIIQLQCLINNQDNVGITISVTTNNSSYTMVNGAYDGNNGSGSRMGGAASFSFIDVTDTSNVKVKFTAASLGSGSEIEGRNDYVQTGFHFIRIGDT